MSEGFAGGDAHAFVDNSLSPSDRASFEAALRRDAKLRARVDAWEAQNEAIRLAFGGATRAPRHAPPIGRQVSENGVTTPSVRVGEPAKAQIRGFKPKSVPSRTPQSWRTAACTLVLSGVLIVFAGGPADPRTALMRCADADLRIVTTFADTRLDIVSDDPQVVAAWLGGRLVSLDPQRLRAPGWSLLGARVVPGVGAAAALVLFEDAIGGRAGLLLEPADAMPNFPPSADRLGEETLVAGVDRHFAYAVVGPARSGVNALIPTEAQPGP